MLNNGFTQKSSSLGYRRWIDKNTHTHTARGVQQFASFQPVWGSFFDQVFLWFLPQFRWSVLEPFLKPVAVLSNLKEEESVSFSNAVFIPNCSYCTWLTCRSQFPDLHSCLIRFKTLVSKALNYSARASATASTELFFLFCWRRAQRLIFFWFWSRNCTSTFSKKLNFSSAYTHAHTGTTFTFSSFFGSIFFSSLSVSGPFTCLTLCVHLLLPLPPLCPAFFVDGSLFSPPNNHKEEEEKREGCLLCTRFLFFFRVLIDDSLVCCFRSMMMSTCCFFWWSSSTIHVRFLPALSFTFSLFHTSTSCLTWPGPNSRPHPLHFHLFIIHFSFSWPLDSFVTHSPSDWPPFTTLSSASVRLPLPSLVLALSNVILCSDIAPHPLFFLNSKTHKLLWKPSIVRTFDYCQPLCKHFFLLKASLCTCVCVHFA